MGETALQRLGLAGLARATQGTLDWRNWGHGANRSELDSSAPSKEVLDKLIEAEIIPRLMLTTRDAADRARPAATEGGLSRSFAPDEIDAFARRTVTSDAGDLVDEVNRLIADGVSHEDILLKLLAPAARRLGKLWDEDLCDFADVTIGLMKLHRVLGCVNAEAPTGIGAGGASPRVLLAPAPGEQHVFGVVMVGEFFARSGWRVRCESVAESEHLVATVANDHFDVVGLSASSDVNMKALKTAIHNVRNASCNPDIVIMVGGQLFSEDVSLARRVGADATAIDGVRAVVTAERLVHRLARAEGATQQ
jgi:methylmalonyl-CoA mutase cobalamin-binding domain/chain